MSLAYALLYTGCDSISRLQPFSTTQAGVIEAMEPPPLTQATINEANMQLSHRTGPYPQAMNPPQ